MKSNCTKKYQQLSTLVIIIFTASIILITTPAVSQALTVGPVKVELTGQPGETLKGEYFLMNEAEKTKTFYPCFERYIEEGGQRKFFPNETEGISTWIKTAVKSVTLKPKEQIYIPFEIHIPKDAPAGSHFAVTWWSTAPCKEQTMGTEGVAIVTRAGVLMLVNVEGDIQESGHITEFSLPKKLMLYFPQIFRVVFENTGNVYLKPVGKIEVKNLLGMDAAVFNVNAVELEVYPKTKKSLRVTMGEEFYREVEAPPEGFWKRVKFEWRNFGIGPYKAILSLSYGQEKTKHLSQSFWFFVLPWRLILIFVVLLILVLFVCTKGVKAYNQWILKRAQTSEKTQNEAPNNK